MEENGNIMEEDINIIEENDNIMEENDNIMEENDEMMEEDDNTGGGLSLYQLSTAAIVRNFSPLRDEILRCPEKILFDVFYQVLIENIITRKNYSFHFSISKVYFL